MQKNIKYILSTIVGLAIVIGIVYGVYTNMANASTLVGKDVYVANNPGPEKYKKAREPIMTSSINTDTISAKRGKTFTVLLTLTHEAGSNPNAKFTVTPTVDGFFMPSSVLNSTTMQQRSTMLANEQIPNGVIPLKDLVNFSPPFITLKSGESKEIQMQIVLPSSLPDEIVGHSLIISPTYVISDKAGIDQMGVFTTSVRVNVVE